VRELAADLALLPVNGRDATRAQAGIPGNFTLDEAIALCAETGMTSLLAHHFGLFAFNTIDPATIDAAAALRCSAKISPGLLRPDTQHTFRLRH
jgi:L-ascorbate metabolism protein UlaG (beta-lactamase superfamily)